MSRRPLWQDEGRRTCPLTFKLMCSPLVSSFVSAMALNSVLPLERNKQTCENGLECFESIWDVNANIRKELC
jgi:hypothetical protein